MTRILFYILLLANGFCFYFLNQKDIKLLISFTLVSVVVFTIVDLIILKKIKLKNFLFFSILLFLISGTFGIFVFFNKYLNYNVNLSYFLVLYIITIYIVLSKSSDQLDLFFSGKKEVKNNSLQSIKILDTSAIIDGRISDIGETNFIDGPFIVPSFVLKELQLVADSSDHQKRTVGRRGLSILNQMKNSKNVSLMVESEDFIETKEVDLKLIKLAKLKNGKIITTDYNLNKVAEVEGISVLNVNDLANALKPNFIPGDSFKLAINKKGKEKEQGLGYLDDGTMVVIEDGRGYIGETHTVHVTSVIQNSAGRIVFAKVNIDK